MNELMHNGIPVHYDENPNFLKWLHKNGIIPFEIPDPNFNYRVFRYEFDGEKRYACVIGATTPGDGEYFEKIFITSEIPEDGFENLMKDCMAQRTAFLSHSEHEPEKIKSRLHLAVEKAVKNADEFIAKKYPEESFFWALNGDYPDSVKKERQKLISEKLNFTGYYVDMIDYLDEPEGYRNFVKKLLADEK